MARRQPQPMPAAGTTVTFDAVPVVTSLADLFALSIAMEREAAARYATLADEMAQEGEADLAALFRRLEQAEADHENGVIAWAGRMGIAPSRELGFRWDGTEGPSRDDLADGGATLTPWKALAIAVRNEERAFAFYARIAAEAPTAEVRDTADQMAQEELEHVALLRLERRRAWRGDYRATMAALPAAGLPQAANPGELTAYARTVALETAGRLRSKAALARETHEEAVALLLQDLAEDAEARARSLGAEAAPPDIHVAPGRGIELLRDEERRLARLYDGYMRLIETSDQQDVIAGARAETGTILAHLARLHDERLRQLTEAGPS